MIAVLALCVAALGVVVLVVMSRARKLANALAALAVANEEMIQWMEQLQEWAEAHTQEHETHDALHEQMYSIMRMSREVTNSPKSGPLGL